MGILDDVVVNAKSAAEALSRRAGQVVDVSKLRISAAELNAEVSKRYEALGEYVFEALREKLADDPEAVGKMAEIDELKAQCEAVNREINDKQNRIVCPVCGKKSVNTAFYCASCGARLIQEPVEAPVEEPAPAEPKEDEAE